MPLPSGISSDATTKRETQRREEIVEQREFWTKYVRVMKETIAEAIDQGERPPKYLPHPDDVVIDHDGVRFIGPCDQESEDLQKLGVKLIDALLQQSVLDDRRARTPGRMLPHGESSSALVVAVIANGSLFKRYQMTDGDIISAILDFHRKTKRELLRDVHRAWRFAGIPMRRGVKFPAISALKSVLDEIRDGAAGS
jgi:hypothetical protein